jgi:hypothetical protein
MYQTVWLQLSKYPCPCSNPGIMSMSIIMQHGHGHGTEVDMDLDRPGHGSEHKIWFYRSGIEIVPYRNRLKYQNHNWSEIGIKRPMSDITDKFFQCRCPPMLRCPLPVMKALVKFFHRRTVTSILYSYKQQHSSDLHYIPVSIAPLFIPFGTLPITDNQLLTGCAFM